MTSEECDGRNICYFVREVKKKREQNVVKCELEAFAESPSKWGKERMEPG